MAILRLGICVIGVYAMFLLWAIAQERLSVPFKSRDGLRSEKYHSVLFMGTCQSAASAFTSFVYILLRRKPGEKLLDALGMKSAIKSSAQNGNGHAKEHPDGKTRTHQIFADYYDHRRSLLMRFLQCSLLITFAAPFGFAALSHISYPTMVLGKSCKLVPVMLMNVLLYRRKFAPHKYLVVIMVTLGITMFMGFGGEKSKKSTPSSSSVIGILYLLINLGMDGAINSTQDEVFARYKVTGQQMMFWINVLSTLITSVLSVLPLPYIPVLHPSSGGHSEFGGALTFIHEHPSIISPLLQFALTGSLGQLFIFETLQHFGSLTLVTITLTRKLFTMVLSVVVYNHRLTWGQWAGAAVVFAGISVEAWVKRKDIHAKRVIQEKEKASIKSL